ncbi:MAG TPA: monovalent cation:proton antiporter-2 (CPA2) family protein [Hyphomicrobiaceae bacterium]|nr:monovalent cation:proton antiporter-2 (CPA2) family protein [Hyphomicrobiaceae bacterium]
MAAEASGPDLAKIVALLGAAVVAVPIFKRLGLGSVLGYLAAGLAIGPFGLALFTDPQAIIHVAELGVVMFLFIVGLEMEPARLWGLRREIFGLGALQVGLCSALLTIVGLAMGFPLGVSFIAAAGFVLTSTAIVMQVLEERGEMSTPKGQRMVSILLLEDLGIVPLLALVAFLAPGGAETTLTDRLMAIGVGIASIVSLIAVGRYLLNPLFSLLANAKAREILTAAALLVVLGSALALQLGGLSMAMGAFLAGVLLSQSSFRHQLEADIEPFRGLLLGLFFLGVGMALDLGVIANNWRLVLAGVVSYMTLKFAGIYAVARVTKSSHRESLERAVIMCQGGEFAFVLYAAATSVGLLTGEKSAILTAVVIISMVLTPMMIILHDRLTPPVAQSMDGVEAPNGLESKVLIIGFGRFGQIVSQPLLARGHTISFIETDTESIRDGADFGFKVHYGDGTRLDILHAAGAASARAIIIAIDKPESTQRIAEICHAEFPLVPVFARSFDRTTSLQLVQAGVDYQIRETFESALAMAEEALVRLGCEQTQAADVIVEFRRRDAERFELEASGGLYAGRALLISNIPISQRRAEETTGDQEPA